MTYNPRSVFQSYEQYGKAKTRQAQASKSKNANQQAAKTMGSVGIGGLGGRTTTSSAKQIQDKFRRETQRDSGSTYDEVPQTITTGLGSRKTQPSKDKDMSVGTKIDRAFIKVMTSLIPDFSPPKDRSVFPMQVYGGPLFTVPTPTPVSIEQLDAAPRDTTRTFAPSAMEPPTLPTTTTDSDVGVVSPSGLMSPPTMTKPETSKGLMGIPRALAMASAEPPTEDYVVQEGDTLSEIAEREGTTVKALADLNNIPESDVDIIMTGEKLKVPAKLTDTQAALRRGLGSRKDNKGIKTAGGTMEELRKLLKAYTDEMGDKITTDPDSEFYDSFRQGVMTKEEFDEALVDRIVELEGFIPEAEMAFKTDRHPTIGYGQSDSTVKLGQKTTQKQAEKNLKENLIPERIKTAKRLFPDFNEFSDPLKIEIVQGVFRGDFKKEHDTVKLINQKKWDEAAVEFLDHAEYEEAKRLGKKSDRRGIVTRLEAISEAIKEEQYK